MFGVEVQATRRLSHTQKIKGNNNRQSITTVTVTNSYEQPAREAARQLTLSELRPEAIVKEVDDSPLYQQRNVEKAYEGRKVIWEVKLAGIRDSVSAKTNFRLQMYPASQSIYPVIFTEVSKHKYPELKTVKKNELIIVGGIIEKVDQGVIRLKQSAIHEIKSSLNV